MAETVSRMLSELRQRRDELGPMVEELNQVEAAISALEQLEGPSGGQRRRGPGRPRGSGSGPRRRSGSGARRGRPPKGQPTRSDQFLALVGERPGITISEAASELGIEPNYLYRVSATLQREGTITREGRGFQPAVAAPAGGAAAEVVEPPTGDGAGAPEAVESAEEEPPLETT